jgi:hypothetical protein
LTFAGLFIALTATVFFSVDVIFTLATHVDKHQITVAVAIFLAFAWGPRPWVDILLLLQYINILRFGPVHMPGLDFQGVRSLVGHVAFGYFGILKHIVFLCVSQELRHSIPSLFPLKYAPFHVRTSATTNLPPPISRQTDEIELGHNQNCILTSLFITLIGIAIGIATGIAVVIGG